jgi:amino acid adenylation domain-containing protein
MKDAGAIGCRDTFCAVCRKHNARHVSSISLPQVFSARCDSGGDRLAYAFLRDDLSTVDSLTFAQLGLESRELAGRLASVAPAGSRVLLAFPPGLDFVRAFWACMVAGCVAVPVPAPDPVRLLRAMPRLWGILEDTSATLVLSSDSVIDAARATLDPALFALAPWQSLSALGRDAIPASTSTLATATAPDALAYLQYTSGSTMTPRGVRLTHAQVLANVAALDAAGRVDAESRILTWLPHFHDYGLVHGVIAPMVAGATSWLMSPLVFLRRPLRWLEALSSLRITHSGAPASAYIACLRALEGRSQAELPGAAIDLSALVSLNCGAEPIRADTVAEVLAVLGAAGLRAGAFMPGYGLAETVLGVSGGNDGGPGDSPLLLTVDAAALAGDRIVVREEDGDANQASRRRLVGCGRPLDGTEIAIVDPARLQRLAPDAVGEIWVRSSSVGDGYWNQSDASREVFGARLVDGSGPFLRTGDLGFMHRGQLFVTGRSKDLVIVHGGNHYPQDLEWTAEHAHPALRTGYGAAFSVDTPVGESLVLALETERRVVSLDAGAIASAVRRAIGETHGIPVETVVLVRSGSLPRSSSGKIQRSLSRRQFLDGTLEVQAVVSRHDAEEPEDDDAQGTPSAQVSRVMPRDETEQAIWDIWREVLGTAAFGVHESFFELGGTSLLITQVASRIGQRIGVELPLSVLFDQSSVGALADHVTRALIDAGNASQGTGDAQGAKIVRVPRGRPLPVSLSQRRMWLIQQFDPASSAYNVAISLRVRGALDIGVLQRAVDLMVERHESLRTRLVQGADEPMQVIEEARPMPIEHIDLSAHSDPQAAARALFAERIAMPFDLVTAPLHRATLLRFGAQDHALMWVMHHAIADNWSFTVLMREVLEAYAAWHSGGTPELAPVPIEYADYAAWQRSPAAVAQRKPQMLYWRERLADLAPLDLPTDFPRPARPSFRGGRASATLSPRLRGAIRAFCAREAVTPFVVLLAAFKLMLARQVRGNDIAVGTPVANRHRFSAEHLVGTLVNTLVMRTDLGGDPGYVELVRRVRSTAVDAYAHQEAPFDELVETLGHDRAVHPEGLVRVLFNVLNAPLGRLDHAGLDLEEFVFDRSTAQFDLSVHIDTEFTHRVHFEYATDLYAASTIERMRDNYLALLDAVLATPSQPLSSFGVVAPAQLASLRDRWNATQVALPAEQTVHRYLPIADAARRDVVALRDAEGRDLSYGELEARSNRLAHALRARGIGRGHRVGLGVKRDAVMVVAMLGVLKSGAGYVPLDPGFPGDRLQFMAADAGLSALLTRGVPAGWLADAGIPLLALQDDGTVGGDLAAPATVSADTALAPDARFDAQPLDVAYMIYTSGSTGRPKGVAVPHRAVVNFLASMARTPGLSAADRLVAVTTLSFDIAVLELLLPLAVGAQAVIADASQVHDPHALRDLLARHDATAMQATPTLWRTLLDAGWAGRDSGDANCNGFKALVGGEPMPPLLAEQLLATDAEVWNMYGPTETTVWSTVWRVASPREGISIGRPIDNTTVQVLDESGHPCPVGVPGELCIGGAGVTLGYHQRDELTADRFPPDTGSTEPGARFYRTGDLGRWRHDGWLEHLGRLDRQVKLRGLRIELGEIESALLDIPEVGQCVVDTRADRADREQDVRLVAYLVARDGDSAAAADALDIAAVREHLRKRLPDYMLPQYVVWLKALPQLPNGKIDRAALPAPQVDGRPSLQAGARPGMSQRSEPVTPAEHAIAAIWRDLLDVEVVDLRDNFFDLGGHSLLAMRAVIAIREKLGWDIAPPRLVYETLGQIAKPQNLETAGLQR